MAEMRRTSHMADWITAGALFLLFPLAGFAQRPGSSRVAPPPSRGGNVTVIINNNATPPAATVPASSFNFTPVPGLGFDMVHLAATRGPAAVGAAPGQFMNGTAGTPSFTGGVFIPTAPTIVIQVPPIVIQQPVIIQQSVTSVPAEAGDTPRVDRGKRDAEEAPKEIVKEAPEYVFIRRDGTVLFAVAFLLEKDRIECVTREGQRRAIAIAALDLEATKKFNEERGLSFRIPS